MKPYTPYVRPFSACEPYSQEEPGEAKFYHVIKTEEFPGLSSGLVHLQGPIHKTPATHETWDQAYIILAGNGIVHLGDTHHPVSGETVVVIPRGTHHSVEVKSGDFLRYVYINQYLIPERRKVVS